ncbi:MAG: nucleotidyltransferase domain-containing protein [Cellulomonadaceae bacterium]|jgi:predicted nucleotidyltransferase|nr:nucleotidyltransferase domain-containing protein [Cellulomonadaceae bacterium]
MTKPAYPDSQAIAAVCQKHQVRKLWLFGSALRDDFDPERSDFDFLVEFPEQYDNPFRTYFELQDNLEKIVGYPVDLVTKSAIRNPFFAQEIARTAKELYAS